MKAGRTLEGFLSQFQMKRICFLLLWVILPTLGACATPIPPRYQPFLEGSSSAHSVQGYIDVQLDGHTYFVRYENYYVLMDRCDERSLKGAQEYVLYRAAELAKSKGTKYFVVLHKDDWNLASALRATRATLGQKYGSRGAEAVINEGSPGAGLICTAHDFLDTVVAGFAPPCGSQRSAIVAPRPTVGVVF